MFKSTLQNFNVVVCLLVNKETNKLITHQIHDNNLSIQKIVEYIGTQKELIDCNLLSVIR